MERIYNREKQTSTALEIFSIMVFALLIYISYSNKQLYGISNIISRLTLTILMLTFTIGFDSFKLTYTNFIGITYIIFNAIYILSLLLFGVSGYLVESVIISNVLESITIFIAISNIYKKRIISKAKLIKTFLLYLFLAIAIYFMINYGDSIVEFYDIKLNIFNITVLINIILLFVGIKKVLLYIKNSNEYLETINLKLIGNIIFLKIFYFLGIFILSKTNVDINNIYTLLESINILETYFVYKITVDSNLINPYIMKVEINEELQEKKQNQQFIARELNDILNDQNEIKTEINYKEDLFYQLFSTTPNGWVVFNENKEITYFNTALKNMCSYEEHKDINKALKCFIKDYDKFIKAMCDISEDNESIEIEIQSTTKEYYRCIYSKYQESNEIVCILVNISSEKNLLNNLIELKLEYEELIRNIKSPIVILDENNKYINCSKSYEDIILKYKVYDEDIEYFNRVTNINYNARSNNELYNNGIFRYRSVDLDGNIVWLECSTTIYYERNKKYRVVSYSDITYYIKSREIINQSKNIYQALLDGIPEAIYLEDIDTNKYVYINKKFKEMFDLVKEDLVDDDLGICRETFMSVHPDYDKVVKESINQVRNGKSSEYVSIKYLDKNNNVIDTQVASIPFNIDKKIFKLTIIKDMDDIRRLESLRKRIIESEQKDSIKMKFFINMSHELKTPLNLIFTSAQLIENLYNKNKIYDANGNVKKHIDLTIQNSYRLIKIINDLIDFTKMESGFYKLRVENKNIVTLVEDITMSVVNYASNNGLNIVFDTNIEDLFIPIDVNAIERIVLNILSNAIKFTNSGGSIYVNVIYKDSIVKIIIEDTGIGIPKDKLSYIFDRFNDINKGYIGNVYGSGIGLSMVKSMVSLLGGDIEVESELNIGTKFTITLNVNALELDKNYYKDEFNNISNIERLTIGMTDVYK